MIHRYVVVGIIQTAGIASILWLFSDIMGFAASMVSLAIAPFFFFARYYANKLWVFETKKEVGGCKYMHEYCNCRNCIKERERRMNRYILEANKEKFR